MNRADFEVHFRGEMVEGYMKDGEIVFYSPIDGHTECKVPKNPYKNSNIEYFKKKEANYDFILKTIAEYNILSDLIYWRNDYNRQITIGEKYGDKVVLIINQIL